MKVIELAKSSLVYTCRSYLLLGAWNSLLDVNTLIDPGTDGSVIEEIENLAAGVGRIQVEQIILTHNHFDHAASVGKVKRHFGARVYGWSDGKEVDELLHDGRMLKAGDDFLKVLHTPGHSSDSICLYNLRNRILFSGDTRWRMSRSVEGFSPEYVKTMRRLAALRIDTVYPGHDKASSSTAQETQRQAMTYVGKSRGLRRPAGRNAELAQLMNA